MSGIVLSFTLCCRNVQLSLLGRCKELWKFATAVCPEAPHSNQSSVSYRKWTSLSHRLRVCS